MKLKHVLDALQAMINDESNEVNWDTDVAFLETSDMSDTSTMSLLFLRGVKFAKATDAKDLMAVFEFQAVNTLKGEDQIRFLIQEDNEMAKETIERMLRKAAEIKANG